MTLIDFLDHGGSLSRDLPCLVEGDAQLSYREVVQWSHRIAWALNREGIREHDRVAILSQNNLWAYVALLGLQRARCVWIPLNARSSMQENIRHLVRTGARLLFVHSEFKADIEDIRSQAEGIRVVCFAGDAPEAPRLEDWVGENDNAYPPPQDDPAADDFRITSSGGTTGEPKAVVQTQRGVEAGVASLLALLHYDDKPRYLLCNPMTHAAGIISFHVLALGGTIYILRMPDLPRVIEQIERHRIAMLMLTPTSLYSLLDIPDISDRDLSSLRYLLIGAAPLSVAKLKQAIAMFGPVVMQGFGQTEASPVVAMMLPSEYEKSFQDPALEHRLHSCGRATPFAKIAIRGEGGRLLKPGERGEIVVRSNMVMRGYWQDGKVVERDPVGWHGTGDIAYQDEEGFIYIVDRVRDLIISGGFNVFPSEVEQAIWSFPEIQDCTVVGVPDAKWGEAVKAIVVLKNGASLSETELIGRCKARLGGVKAPKSVEFWTDLPKSALGKVLKTEVRRMLREQPATSPKP